MDEVCDSKKRPTLEVNPNLERAIVLPLEGKGDRSAVDEVKMQTRSPSRSVKKSARHGRGSSVSGAAIAYCLLPTALKQKK